MDSFTIGGVIGMFVGASIVFVLAVRCERNVPNIKHRIKLAEEKCEGEVESVQLNNNSFTFTCVNGLSGTLKGK